MNILNLYACLGGNRYLWGDDHNITAVEKDPELARMYKERFKNDEVIVGDDHEYLLNNYKQFDFIWSSPPCPSHSKARFWNSKGKGKAKEVYPEMGLYQEIIFLEHFFDGKYVVENVKPYYQPLIKGNERGRHIFWSNFKIPYRLSDRKVTVGPAENEIKNLCEFHNIDLKKYKGNQRKDKIARNMVDYEVGRTILDAAIGVIKNKGNQSGLFDAETY